jgi:3-dehydroshikimate dehydratase
MLKLSAFADEISPDLDEQIRVCRENGITHFELRGGNNVNVMDFDDALRAEIRSRLKDNGMGVIAIGSPIGKVKITDPWTPHFDRFKLAVELAGYFEAPFIRIFSYYPPVEGGNIRKQREEVLRRMGAKVDYIGNHDVVLVHENEKGIYGEKGRDCLDLMESIKSPKLRTAFDFGNFVQAGEKPGDNWPMLKPYTLHIHVKDARMSDGGIVPAGKGDGDIGPILKDAYDSGYRGFLSLEPHLAKGGQFSGFSGPKLFTLAVESLKELCNRYGVPLGQPPPTRAHAAH